MSFAEELRARTKRFAIRAIRLSRDLPNTEDSRIIRRQFLRSATSVASNYRATTRARSDKEFFAKLSIAVEEADETLFWLEIIQEAGIYNGSKIQTLSQEATEITAILAKSRKTLKTRMNNRRN